MSVLPSNFDLLRQSLAGTEVRHRVISQNLANVNTPGYAAQEVEFEQQLADEVRRGSENIGELTPEVRAATRFPERDNGNSVDFDYELTQLNANAVLHQTFAQIISKKVSMMRSAITGQ